MASINPEAFLAQDFDRIREWAPQDVRARQPHRRSESALEFQTACRIIWSSRSPVPSDIRGYTLGPRRYEATVTFPDNRTYGFGLVVVDGEDKMETIGRVQERLQDIEEKWLRSVDWRHASFRWCRGSTDVSDQDPPSPDATMRLELLFQAAKAGDWESVLELAGDALVELVEFKKMHDERRDYE